MRGKWILIGGVALFLAIGVGAVVWYKHQAPPPKPAATKTPELPRGAEISLSVRIRSASVTRIDAPLDGTLEEIAVQVGDEVTEGQILGRIANASLVENEKDTRAELDRAEGRLTTVEGEMTAARLEDSRLSAELVRSRLEAQRAARVCERQQTLFKEGATPRLTYERAERENNMAKTEYERVQGQANATAERTAGLRHEVEQATKTVAEAQAAHEAAQTALASAHLVAPSGGLVVSISKNVGDDVRKAVTALIEIATDLTQLIAEADAPQAYTSRLAAGQPALLVMAELPGEGLPVTLKSVEPGRATVEFATPTPLVRPGMTGLLKLKLDPAVK
jgi:multidrug resistance efflux pump